MITTLAEAKLKIESELAERVAAGRDVEVEQVDFVLCEDFRSVMIYVHTADEDGVAHACFDWPLQIPFSIERCELAYADPKRLPYTMH